MEDDLEREEMEELENTLLEDLEGRVYYLVRENRKEDLEELLEEYRPKGSIRINYICAELIQNKALEDFSFILDDPGIDLFTEIILATAIANDCDFYFREMLRRFGDEFVKKTPLRKFFRKNWYRPLCHSKIIDVLLSSGKYDDQLTTEFFIKFCQFSSGKRQDEEKNPWTESFLRFWKSPNVSVIHNDYEGFFNLCMYKCNNHNNEDGLRKYLEGGLPGISNKQLYRCLGRVSNSKISIDLIQLFLNLPKLDHNRIDELTIGNLVFNNPQSLDLFLDNPKIDISGKKNHLLRQTAIRDDSFIVAERYVRLIFAHPQFKPHCLVKCLKFVLKKASFTNVAILLHHGKQYFTHEQLNEALETTDQLQNDLGKERKAELISSYLFVR